MMSSNDCQKRTNFIKKMETYISDTDSYMSSVLKYCDQLCSLEISNTRFEWLLHGATSKAPDLVLRKRVEASKLIIHIKGEFREELIYEKYNAMKRKYLPSAISHFFKYARYYNELGERMNEDGREYDGPLGREMSIHLEEYIRDAELVMEQLPEKNDVRIRFYSELSCYRSADRIIRLVMDKEFQLVIENDCAVLLLLEKEYSADLALYTRHNEDVHYHMSSLDDIVNIQRLIQYETRKQNYLANIITRTKRFRCNTLFYYRCHDYEVLSEQTSDNISKYTKKIGTIHREIAKLKIDDFIGLSVEEKCLLTKERMIAIRHEEVNEMFYVIAACTSTVHYHTLSRIARLSRAGYRVVYEAMKLRLNEYSAFPCLMTSSWPSNTKDNHAALLLAQTAAPKAKKKSCHILATKGTLEQFKVKWHLLLSFNQDAASLDRVQPEMSNANMRALVQAFGLSNFYCDMIYAIVTRYQHMFIEFPGKPNEKSSKLYRRNDGNGCHLLFKLDDDAECYYKLTFIVKSVT